MDSTQQNPHVMFADPINLTGARNGSGAVFIELQ